LNWKTRAGSTDLKIAPLPSPCGERLQDYKIRRLEGSFLRSFWPKGKKEHLTRLRRNIKLFRKRHPSEQNANFK
ncbi:hypothetical protein KAX21_00305, partial [candidate division WOR-3 bacterium]|nr:hypothetical protein [candidate division WOR-3 bacterium]